MKIFMTGATASQTPNLRVGSVPTFASLLYRALTTAEHEVVWTDPSMALSKEYLSEFDCILVGIAPINSVTAYKIYGALSVIDYAWELGTLKLFIDAPEPKKIWSGLRAIYNNPTDINKNFYFKRKDYKETFLSKNFDRLLSSVERLYTDCWPITLYPSLPWTSSELVYSNISTTNNENLVGINYDSILIEEFSNSKKYLDNPSGVWVSDAPNSSWSKSIEKTIRNPVVPLSNNKWEDSKSVLSKIRSSVGCLVSTYKDDSPWWSTLVSQGISMGTPVVTDWRLSSSLGYEWSMLAHSIEELSDYDRKSVSAIQKIAYLEAVPSWKNSIKLTSETLTRK